MSARYLIDKSALARRSKPAVREVVDPLHLRGLLAVTGAVRIEMTHSARDKAEAARLAAFLSAFDHLPCPDGVWDRALEVQQLAVGAGFHRALSMADLLISATAERHGAAVLHYDGDFEMIASLTGQPHRWVVPPGTAD
ncbi:PIN domain nuclease [Streptomyces sp. NPDC096030]|uniref:PIN domain nuclease n=1 Tax=Streptomyces sp. NPDC096030 TaxID=3155423 RepID=UPI00331F1557